MHQSIELNNLINVYSIVASFRAPFFKNQLNNRLRNDYWEMIYTNRDEIIVNTDNNEFVLKQGYAAFHKPMEYHQHRGNPDRDADIIVLSFGADGPLMKYFDSAVIKLDYDSDLLLKHILELSGPIDFMPNPNISAINHISSAINSQLVRLNIEQFLIKLIELNEKNHLHTNTSRRNFDTIINVLNKNVYNRLTMGEIARLCNMSESNLKKTFRVYSDAGIMTYFNHLKIETAKKLLCQGVPIGSVSHALSFQSQDYFCVFFKRYTGITPSQYRNSFNK